MAVARYGVDVSKIEKPVRRCLIKSLACCPSHPDGVCFQPMGAGLHRPTSADSGGAD
jgi:hypothetical protein